MCSSKDQTAVNLENAQAAMTNTVNTDYSTTFAEQQAVLAQQQARLSYIAANPMGLSSQQLASSTTAINENTATATRQALGSAAAFAATHGGAADVGGGGAAQLSGEIASQGAEEKSRQLAQLSNVNQETKQQNFWKSIEGLNQVGAEYGNQGSTAIGSSGSLANASTNAGDLALKSGQAGWEEAGGLISGISGLASAGISGGLDIADAAGKGTGTPWSPSAEG